MLRTWRAWQWAKDEDVIVKLEVYTDGAAALASGGPLPTSRVVKSAGWAAVWLGTTQEGRQVLLGGSSASVQLQGSFAVSAPSAPAAELTAAAAIAVLLDTSTEAAVLREIWWISDSKYALDVTTFTARTSVNTRMAGFARRAWASLGQMTATRCTHVKSHTGVPGNECADVMAELGRRGYLLGASMEVRISEWLAQEARKEAKPRLELASLIYWTDVLDRQPKLEPLLAPSEEAPGPEQSGRHHPLTTRSPRAHHSPTTRWRRSGATWWS